MTFANFISMGGYGLYVWSAYAIVAVILLANLAMSYWHFKQIFRNKIVSHSAKLIIPIEINEEP